MSAERIQDCLSRAEAVLLAERGFKSRCECVETVKDMMARAGGLDALAARMGLHPPMLSAQLAARVSFGAQTLERLFGLKGKMPLPCGPARLQDEPVQALARLAVSHQIVLPGVTPAELKQVVAGLPPTPLVVEALKRWASKVDAEAEAEEDEDEAADDGSESLGEPLDGASPDAEADPRRTAATAGPAVFHPEPPAPISLRLSARLVREIEAELAHLDSLAAQLRAELEPLTGEIELLQHALRALRRSDGD